MAAYRRLNIIPVFNLSYSPDYNPIESVFSQVKRIYKAKRLNRLANNEEFDTVWEVEDAFYKVPPSKIDPCIRHSMKLLEDLNNLA
jgi:transposase